MPLRIIRKTRAVDDIIDVAYHIAEDNLDASSRFFAAVEQEIRRLAEMPEIGTLRDFGRSNLKETRVWPVPGFRKYLIIYRVSGDVIRIIRVLHGARDIASLIDDGEED